MLQSQLDANGQPIVTQPVAPTQQVPTAIPVQPYPIPTAVAANPNAAQTQPIVAPQPQQQIAAQPQPGIVSLPQVALDGMMSARSEQGKRSVLNELGAALGMQAGQQITQEMITQHVTGLAQPVADATTPGGAPGAAQQVTQLTTQVAQLQQQLATANSTAATATSSADDTIKASHVLLAAGSLGVQGPALQSLYTVLKADPVASQMITVQNGSVIGADAAVRQLLANHPYLLTNAPMLPGLIPNGSPTLANTVIAAQRNGVDLIGNAGQQAQAIQHKVSI